MCSQGGASAALVLTCVVPGKCVGGSNPDLHMCFQGMCVGGLPHGEGLCKYPNGDTYDGAWRNGQRCVTLPWLGCALAAVALASTGPEPVPALQCARSFRRANVLSTASLPATRHGYGACFFAGGGSYEGWWRSDQALHADAATAETCEPSEPPAAAALAGAAAETAANAMAEASRPKAHAQAELDAFLAELDAEF